MENVAEGPRPVPRTFDPALNSRSFIDGGLAVPLDYDQGGIAGALSRERPQMRYHVGWIICAAKLILGSS